MDHYFNPLWPRRLGTHLALLLLTAILTPVASIAQSAATPLPQATPVANGPSPGAPGIGDPYFPLLGNGGYDALHYSLDLSLDVEEGSILDATAAIDAIATQDLSSFNFDFRGPEIDTVAVNGEPAAWARDGGELTITPAQPISNGEPFQTVVRYHGTPEVEETDRFERGWWANGTSIFAV
ncbi:MAG: hypothetical protein ACRDJC_26780, partial [Thermomicrobiales bacterium]